ncbi:small integral membrane protein 4 isoform X1 [Microtus oregoni]|uniref:small integral membrane protein 4 isoform X1 n=1 Tax=Microtus oregoni TaxID=111838 RepID=UPI001BB120C0|nr:small integral membrane protein 4 isoform X1 [Microtus oregoni]
MLWACQPLRPDSRGLAVAPRRGLGSQSVGHGPTSRPVRLVPPVPHFRRFGHVLQGPDDVYRRKASERQYQRRLEDTSETDLHKLIK